MSRLVLWSVALLGIGILNWMHAAHGLAYVWPQAKKPALQTVADQKIDPRQVISIGGDGASIQYNSNMCTPVDASCFIDAPAFSRKSMAPIHGPVAYYHVRASHTATTAGGSTCFMPVEAEVSAAKHVAWVERLPATYLDRAYLTWCARGTFLHYNVAVADVREPYVGLLYSTHPLPGPGEKAD